MDRLNKYLAHAGVGSRRHCDTLIAAGRVKVNGTPVSDLGLKIDPAAHTIAVDDHPVKVEKPVYWVVNKPVGYLSTNSDPEGRPRAVDLLPHVDQRVYTVGRLDEASEGMLLMTNDGELAFHLMHPRFGIPKTYLVLVAGKPTTVDIQKLLDGVWLSDGKVRAKSVRRMKPQGNSTWLRIVLTEGKNREVRRMLAQLGHKVMRLKRVAIGPVPLDKLPKGKARKVSESELKDLRNWVETSKERIANARGRAAGKRAAGEQSERDETAGPDDPRPRPYTPTPRRPNEFKKSDGPKRTGEPKRTGRVKRVGRPKLTGEPKPTRDPKRVAATKQPGDLKLTADPKRTAGKRAAAVRGGPKAAAPTADARARPDTPPRPTGPKKAINPKRGNGPKGPGDFKKPGGPKRTGDPKRTGRR